VLLDAAGTLIRPRVPVERTYAAVARQFGLTLAPGDLAQTFAAALASMPDLAFTWSSRENLQRQERDWWRTLVRRVAAAARRGEDSTGDFEGFFESLFAHYAQGRAWECFPDVQPTLQALRDLGCRLAVVSNFDSRLPAILRSLGIWVRMDAVVYSSETGSAKPDPLIFARALAVLGVAPEHAIHVGDDPRADVAGAAAAGIAGLLIRRGDAPAASAQPVIRDLRELLGRVGAGDPSPPRSLR
jgi:putative hydrolase of the HAD superfamily